MRTVIRRILGDTFLGMMDYYRHPDWLEMSWGGPLNGQKHRQKTVENLLHHLPLAAIVETGTHRGNTCAWLAALTHVPIYTVEHNGRLHGFSLRALRRFRNVLCFRGDSRSFLRNLATHQHLTGRVILFYLDAHEGADLPLGEELEIIFDRWDRAVVLIDDFEVVDDPGYGYDDYGPGRALNTDYIRSTVAKFGLYAFFPAVPSAEETGRKRGSITLVADFGLAQMLRGMPDLREYLLLRH